MKYGKDRRSKGCGRYARAAGLGLLAAVLLSCARDPRLDALEKMEQPTGAPPSPQRIDELKETIEEYEQVVSQKVNAAMRQASYLKLLAQEYMRQELYGPALDALNEAIVLEPRNQVLQQLAGVCAAYIAKAQGNPEERDRYFDMAERFYKYSIEIDPSYKDGLFALGTLYHFELGRHLDAVNVLNRLLEISPSDIQALFVIARAYAALGNVDQAIAAYDRIIENAPDRSIAEQARRNRLLLEGE